MKKYILSIIGLFIFPTHAFMKIISDPNQIGNITPNGSWFSGGSMTLIGILTMIQSFLLKAVLPLVVVGTALYVAYHLLTAEGDEARMKQAWKSLTYSSIALIVIALSYAMVSVFTNLSL